MSTLINIIQEQKCNIITPDWVNKNEDLKNNYTNRYIAKRLVKVKVISRKKIKSICNTYTGEILGDKNYQ